MTEIWPAGPPKLSNATRNHARMAVAKDGCATSVAGCGVAVGGGDIGGTLRAWAQVSTIPPHNSSIGKSAGAARNKESLGRYCLDHELIGHQLLGDLLDG
jgi:hypothetical protein